jgi:hypothetical protein
MGFDYGRENNLMFLSPARGRGEVRGLKKIPHKGSE